jgi:hypothetical protein
MATFDIKDLYVNKPIEETLKITEQQLMKNNDKQKTKQIIAILHTILKQNYFEYQSSYNIAGLEDTTNQAPHGTRDCMCS